MAADLRFRTEQDSLGSVDVPIDAYYGPQTMRAVRNFPISGLRLPRPFIAAQGMVKYAAAQTHRALGLLDVHKADAVLKAAREVIDGAWDHQFVVDVYQAGAGTSQNMNANEVIANRALELLDHPRGDYRLIHPNDDVNRAQSTNDTMHVCINIATSMTLHRHLFPALQHLWQTLDQKASEFDPIVKSGRTHLQDAVPIRLGQEFSGYAAAIRERIRQIQSTGEGLLAIGLGGTAVGTGLNAHPQFGERSVRVISELTGLAFRLPDNLFRFVQNLEEVADVANALEVLACTVGKIANDLRLLSSGPRTGIAELQLMPVQPGSSIMPGKVNPVVPEMMNMVCYQVMGHVTTVLSACQAAQLELNVMMPVIAYNILQATIILGNALRVFTDLAVAPLKADRDRCEQLVMQSTSLVTSLNPLIGYDRAASIAKTAFREGLTVREVVERERLLSESQIAEFLDPARLTRPAQSDVHV